MNVARRRIVICVCTYRRPEGLKKLLSAIGGLKFSKSTPPVISAVVVENEAPGQYSSELCRDFSSRFGLRIQAVIEPRRGISYARNRAVAMAIEESDFAAFIDDDESPDPLWLDELLDAQRRYQADAVCGPVLPHYETSPPAWITRGKFFERPRYQSGMALHEGRTGNFLIKSSVLAAFVPAFDERFALSGGEDTHFFLRLLRAGTRLVWCDEGVVYESVPPSRLTTNFLLRRAYAGGNSYTRAYLDASKTSSARYRRLLSGLGRIFLGAFAAPYGALRGKDRLLKSLQEVCLGLGILAALRGRRSNEYGRIR